MHLLAEPPLGQWRLSPCRGRDRHVLAALVTARGAALEAAPLSTTCPLLATGHQPWLWHPGILAKDIVLKHAAEQWGAGACHVVVDHQEEFDALRLELPIHRAGRMAAETLALAAHLPAVPTGSQPPADFAAARAALESARQRLGDALLADLTPLVAALGDLPACATLAQQITVVLNRLMRPWAGRVSVLFSSEILSLPRGRALVQRMLDEARACVAAYNGALAQFPHVRISALRSEPDRVELPLWYLSWRQPRRRVFADLSGTPPLLTLEDGRPLDLPRAAEGEFPDPTAPHLAPKALLLTVLMRGWYCDLFIHGTGGGSYDPVMESWWRDWTGQALAPMTVMSADLCLPVPPGVALAHRADLHRAVWWNHHLPHNVDRALNGAALAPDDPATAVLSARKRDLLAHMRDDRDRRRRAAAFAELHQVNGELAAAHPDLFTAARAALDAARLGLANRALAHKRDWCFALYPPTFLEALARAIAAQLPPAAAALAGTSP